MIFPNWAVRLLKRTYYHWLRIINRVPRRKILRRVRMTGKVRLAFVISSLPMWRLQDLYDLLSQDVRFDVFIFVVPFKTFVVEQQIKTTEEVEKYLIGKQMPFYRISDNRQAKWKEIDPDVVFYQQIYTVIYPEAIDPSNNLDKLICYVPYGLITLKGDWVYNTKYTNLAWKLFYPSRLHADFAREHSFNKADNVEVVGEPDADRFLSSDHTNPWESVSPHILKKVIWAPHYTILGDGHFNRASFLWLAEPMLELAKKYEEKIQFVLKPHPRLLSALYAHPDWGKEKADTYFSRWEQGANTRVVTGEYVDLFMTSDAMIHDCGSFTAEYLYAGKPVMFVAKDFPAVYGDLDYFGTKCLDLHYKGETLQDLVSFLDGVVLEERDPMKDDREHFRKDFLLKEAGGNTGKRIYQILVDELF